MRYAVSRKDGETAETLNNPSESEMSSALKQTGRYLSGTPDPEKDVRNHFFKIIIKKERIFFNDALNTFYLQLYGVRHMVKDHSDSERGNPLPPH